MELTWEILPFIRLGGFELRYYSLLFIVVFLSGWGLYRWQVVRGGGTEADANWMLGIGIVTTWFGGRLAHLVFYEPETFFENPWVFLDVQRGGLASHGAWVAMALALAVYAKWRKQSFVEMCDRMAFTSALGGGLIRIGNFFNSEIVGRATDQTWGVRFPRYEQRMGVEVDPRHFEALLLRHPAQLYEAVWLFLVFGLLIVVDRRLGEKRSRGLLCGLFIVLYFGGRFFLEFFKEFEGIEVGTVLTMGQWLSIPSAMVGSVVLVWSFRRAPPANWITGKGAPGAS
jgi:prolipoprotein diacylglyceryl transferase